MGLLNDKMRDEAIVKKVEKILNSSDYIDSAEIKISLARGEISIINYNVKEYIVLDDIDNN